MEAQYLATYLQSPAPAKYLYPLPGASITSGIALREAQCSRTPQGPEQKLADSTVQCQDNARQGQAGILPVEAVSVADLQVLALRPGVGVCHAGVIDDFWGANFLNSQRSNDSWDNAGHGTGTSCTLGCPNDGSTGTGLGIALKASSCHALDASSGLLYISTQWAYTDSHAMPPCCALSSACDLPAEKNAKPQYKARISCKATSLQVPVMWLHAVQVAIMPCKAMSDTLDIPYSGAVACIEWCKTNFENIASMGGRQKTGIYTAAWGSDNAYDSGTLKAAIQRVGAWKESCGLFNHWALMLRAFTTHANAPLLQQA